MLRWESPHRPCFLPACSRARRGITPGLGKNKACAKLLELRLTEALLPTWLLSLVTSSCFRAVPDGHREHTKLSAQPEATSTACLPQMEWEQVG